MPLPDGLTLRVVLARQVEDEYDDDERDGADGKISSM